MAFTYDNDLPEMPTGAVEWPAIINDIVYKLEAGTKVKIRAGDNLAIGDPVIINIGSAYKCTTERGFGGFAVEATAQNSYGRIQVSGRVSNPAWSWTSQELYFLSETGTITATPTIKGDPIAYCPSGGPATDLILLPQKTPAYNESHKTSLVGTPSTKTGTSQGYFGDISFDVDNLYFCTATDVWKKIPLQTI